MHGIGYARKENNVKGGGSESISFRRIESKGNVSFASNGRIMSGKAQALKFARKKEEDDNWDFLDDENGEDDEPLIPKTIWNPYDDDGYEITDP